MKIFSYRLTRDYGFAPNPFHGFCTLATCKPDIRGVANVGDWVLGIAASKLSTELSNRLIYAMKICSKISFEKYWRGPEFQCKKPAINGSLVAAYGDNIYHRAENGEWIQEDSHHSYPGGIKNMENLNRDTGRLRSGRKDFVLISDHFFYWGNQAVSVPDTFFDDDRYHRTLCKGAYHRSDYSPEFINDFFSWFDGQEFQPGYHGDPVNFRDTIES